MTRLSRQRLNKAVTAVGTTGSPTVTPVMVFSVFLYGALFKLAMRSNSSCDTYLKLTPDRTCSVLRDISTCFVVSDFSERHAHSRLSTENRRCFRRQSWVLALETQNNSLEMNVVGNNTFPLISRLLYRSHEEVYTTKHFPTIKILPK